MLSTGVPTGVLSESAIVESAKIGFGKNTTFNKNILLLLGKKTN
jgi:hypothetical protein